MATRCPCPRFVLAFVTGCAVVLVTLGPSAPPAGAIERPGAAPATGAANGDAPTAAFVSDSMGYTAQAEITAEVTKDRALSYFSSIQGANIADHRADLVKLTRGRGGPDYLVVMLGTAQANNPATASSFAADMRSLLDALTPHVDCIRWLNLLEVPAPFYPGFTANRFRYNAIIRRVAAEYPEVEYFHFATWADLAPRRYRWWDEMHLLPPGDAELGRMVRAAANGCDPALTTGPFWDVPDDHWAAPDITWLHDTGLATGYDNHTYRPHVGSFNLSVTRGQLASMLWRHAGSPTVTTPHPFTDVPAWLRPATRWLWSRQLMTGYPDNTFRPDRPVNRAETTRLLWRTAGAPTGHPPHPFTDMPPWLEPAAVDWIAATAIATGYPDNTYRPSGNLTRAQIARILHRYDTTLATAPPTTPPPASTTTLTTAPPTTAPPPPTTAPAPSTTTTAPATISGTAPRP